MAGSGSSFARALDADKMARLGIRNTMRLAKTYNGARNRSRQRMRVAEYRRSGLTPTGRSSATSSTSTTSAAGRRCSTSSARRS